MLYPLSYGGSATGKGTRARWAERARRGGRRATVGGAPERPPRVLVVDDEAVIRQLIAINLELEGFEVHLKAVHGLDALDKARELDPDVVTLDVMMPELDGLGDGAAGCGPIRRRAGPGS